MNFNDNEFFNYEKSRRKKYLEEVEECNLVDQAQFEGFNEQVSNPFTISENKSRIQVI